MTKDCNFRVEINGTAVKDTDVQVVNHTAEGEFVCCAVIDVEKTNLVVVGNASVKSIANMLHAMEQGIGKDLFKRALSLYMMCSFISDGQAPSTPRGGA